LVDVLPGRSNRAADLLMSRICGTISTLPAPLLPAMLARLTVDPAWRSARETLAGASFGWTGLDAPRLCADGPHVAIVDGHFYNRDELGPASGEAELLITLYRRYGFTEALARINGDFAIALFDATDGTLWLGRDRFGIKPMYYVERPDLFGFASQPQALLALPGIPNTVNRRFVALFAASHYRTIDNAPAESPYAAIAQLPAGYALELRGGKSRIAPWWRLEDSADLTAPESELAEQYRDLLIDAVGRRFATADRPAFTLSGGMDSSSVLAAAVAFSGSKQQAYSTVYADKTYDESAEISSMLDSKVSAWHPVKLADDLDVFDLIGKMVEAHGEPVATATWLSHFEMCRRVAADGVGSLFGGLGGDELNAGEYEYFIFHFADLVGAGRESELHHEIACWSRHHDHPIFRKNAEMAAAALARLTDPMVAGRVKSDRARLTRYYDALDPGWHDLAEFTPILDHPFGSWLKNRTYQDIFRETAPCCLRAEDRQCAAFGLEHFDPFFDHRLVEFMFRVPGAMKIRDGITKRLLREAMRGTLPEETRTRIKKTGWNAPAHIWFSGRGLDRLRDLIASRAFRERGIYNLATVDRLINEHERMTAPGAADDHMMFFWQLVNLETWLAQLSAPFADRPGI
jgi:asparagine synthase (glutamine-hydrolysing)